MRHAIVAALLLVGTAWADVAFQSGNLIVNPGFRQGVDPRSSKGMHHVVGWSAELDDLPGWHVLGHGPMTISAGETGPGRSIGLMAVNAGIEQSVSTVPGKPYELAFDCYCSYDSPRGRSLNVTLDGQDRTFQLAAGEAREEHWSFKATGPDTSVALVSIDGGEGLFIDGVYLGPPLGSGHSGAPDASALLAPLSRQVQQAYDDHNVDHAVALCAADFQYQPASGPTENLDQYRKRLESDFANPQHFNPICHVILSAATRAGQGVVATAKDSYTCEWIDDQAVHHPWVRKTEHEDDWIQQGGQWLMLRSVVRHETVTVDGQPQS